MRAICIAIAAGIALTGCQTVNQHIRTSLPHICTAGTAAHATVSVYASAGKMSPETALAARLAWQVLQPLCINPEEQSTATVVVVAAQAFATISAAVAEAEEAPGS